MELASKYNPADVEGKWYQYWLDNKLFSSKPDGREPYTVVIPPPNVTGVLIYPEWYCLACVPYGVLRLRWVVE